jgi:hypothetical protein
VESLDKGGVIAARSRPLRAAELDGQYEPKGPDITPEMKPRKIYDAYGVDTGLRELTDGRVVLSDLDIAGYTKNGSLVSNKDFLRGYARDFNKNYGHDIITHGPHVNGLDMLDVQQKLGPAVIQKINREIVYIFDETGLVEAIPYSVYEAKYTFGTGPTKLPKLDLQAQELLGGHSIGRHGGQISMVDLQSRVLGTHPTHPQSRHALRFISDEIHAAAVDDAYIWNLPEIEAHFASGGGYREWTFDYYGTIIGEGFSNVGTRQHPVATAVQTSRVTLAFDVHPTEGYYLVTAFPDVR